MKAQRGEPAAAAGGKKSSNRMSRERLDRREFVAGSAVAGATLFLPGALSAAADGKKTFTILHTNDMHSAFIGMGPAADYTPFTLNDDTTRGGYARLAALIAKQEGSAQGSGSCAGARRGRLQHGDRVRRRQPRDRRRTAAHVPDGLRRHHLRQPRVRPRAGRPGAVHRGGRQGRPGSGGARLEHQLLGGTTQRWPTSSAWPRRG